MTAEDRKFRPDVEGLRAVAVGLVVLCHAGVPGLDGGYIGVDVFFVLSGFLITGLLLRERETTGSLSLLGFYARRARRILPAASIVLVATILAAYYWLGPFRGDTVAEDGKWTAMFVANFHLAAEETQYLNVAAPPSPLQHYWSLAVEEQFYLVWPVLFLAVASVAPRANLARKLAVVLVVVIVVSFVWSVLQTDSDPVWAFFSPLTRAWELAVGALLAVSATRVGRIPRRAGPWLGWSGLAIIVGSAVLFGSGTRFPGYAAGLPVLGTAAAVAGGTIAPGCGAERLLRRSPFQLLGKWSYALYLWHWPILIIAEQRAGHPLSLAENLGLIAAGLVLAVITHYLVENPVRYARPLARNPAASLATGLALVTAVFGLCLWQLREPSPGLEPSLAQPAFVEQQIPVSRAPEIDPVADLLAAVAAAPAIQSLPGDLTPGLEGALMDFAWLPPWGQGCLVDWDVLVSPSCVFGDPQGSRTVVLLGDSHAAMWMGAIDSIGHRQHWKVIVLTKTSCPAVSLELFRPLLFGRNLVNAAYPECGKWLSSALARINELVPDAVLISHCNGCESVVDSEGKLFRRPDWATGLTKTLERITAPTTKKIVLGDIPRWSGSLDCLALNPDQIQECSRATGMVTGVTYNDVERAVAEASGATFIDVTPWFCGSVCTVVIGDMVVYTNDYHVTATYAQSLVDVLESALTPLVDGPPR